jgi:cytochrome c oxidase assembly protein subunit 15
MDTDHRRRLLHRLAWVCVLLMLVVTSASAWLRLAKPRPDCMDWPACRSLERPVLRMATPAVLGDPGTMALVRGAHRVAASGVLLTALALVALALAWRPRQRAAGALAIALLSLAVALSALGIVTPGSRAGWVLLGNLLGGLLMLGLAWSLVRRLSAGTATDGPLVVAATAGALLWGVQAALGALAGARLAEAAPVAHLALALLAAPWAFAVGWWASRRGRRVEGTALIATAIAQWLLGIAATAWSAAPAAVLAHNFVAGIGLSLLLGLELAPGRAAAH